jgi:hypothetical protein
VVPWLDDGTDADDQDDEDDDDVVDLADLDGSNDGDVDAPVTSGSDPNSWDPINVDQTP